MMIEVTKVQEIMKESNIHFFGVYLLSQQLWSTLLQALH